MTTTIRFKASEVAPKGRYAIGREQFYKLDSAVVKNVHPKLLSGTIHYQQITQRGMGRFGEGMHMPQDENVTITEQQPAAAVLAAIGLSSANYAMDDKPANPWKRYRGLHKNSSIFREVVQIMDTELEAFNAQ